jgi:nitrogen fixation NifU-like protein
MREFRNPKNFGEMKKPDATGKAGNTVCGDIMEIFLKVGKDRKGTEIIKDIKIKTFGCVVAIANASVLTQLVRGMPLEEAEKISRDDVLKQLGEVPPAKVHCSLLAVDALKNAIQNYKEKKEKGTEI